jgi:O-antigen ligase
MFWRRLSTFLLCLIALTIPIEHKYDKLFRYFSLKLIPPNVILPSFFEKKIYFYPSDIIAIGLLFMAIFALRIPLNRFFVSKYAVFLWGVFLFTFMSIALSPLAHYSTLYIRLLHLATPLILFCFLANANRDNECFGLSSLLLGCVLLTALVQSIIAITQYAIQGPLGLRLLNEPASFCAFIVSSGRLWLFDFNWISKPLHVIRPSGTFPHANVLGGFLSVSILAAYSFFSVPRWRLFMSFLIPFLFFAMSLTFSRSALFSWILGTLVWLSLYFRKNGLGSTYKDPTIRFFLCSIGFSICFSFLVLFEQISDRGGIVNYNQLAQGSDALRVSYQDVALKMIKDHPLHGVGFQQLSLRGLDYTPKNQDVPIASGTHNIYLYLAAETGLLSLATFLLFIFSLLWAACKSPFTPLLASLTSMFIALLFIGGCDFYPLLFQQGKLSFFLTAGLLAANTVINRVHVLKESA